jgi:hypothetical protein
VCDPADLAAEEKIRFTSSILPKWARRTDPPFSPDIMSPGHPLDIGETIDVTPASAADASAINPETPPTKRKRGPPRKNPPPTL